MPVTSNPRIVIPRPAKPGRHATARRPAPRWNPTALDLYGLGAVLARAIREGA